MAQLSNGKALAQQIQAGLTQQIQTLQPQLGRSPVAVPMMGNNPASAACAQGKEHACKPLRIASFGQHLSVAIGQANLAGIIAKLDQDECVDDILMQLPLPDRLNSVVLRYKLAPDKDRVGRYSTYLGRLARGETGLGNCKSVGVMRLSPSYDVAAIL